MAGKYNEIIEDWRLSCAVKESDSGGRLHTEAEHRYRDCFQRDRDRIIHCSAFRRLDYKTQVFVPHQQDHFRTRLTHTIEVAQIARDLARALRLNEDMAEAVALAHDLGHPPFGHSGEKALDELMADHGNFEHNRQSLRIVDYLEHPYPNFRGLNLCNVTRECLAKHSTRYDTPVCEGFDYSLAAPLEGQLVDLCDEIAYTSADVEDALQSGWITTDDLKPFDLWQKAFLTARESWPQARPIHLQIRAAKNVLAILADDAVKTTQANITKAALKSLDDVRAADCKIVAFSPQIADQLNLLQNFMLNNVYTHPISEQKNNEGRQRIAELFALFTANPDKLPSRYINRIDADGLHRVVCDYIAGMTDRYCIQTHEQLCGS